jgi:hypothetical protein
MSVGGAATLTLHLEAIDSNRTTLNGSPATASVKFDSDGTVDKHSTQNIFNWLVSGNAADAEVRFDPSSGSVSAGTVNSWLQLNSDVTWSVTRSTLGTKSVSGTIRLRNRITLVEEPSQTMSITAEVNDESGGP